MIAKWKLLRHSKWKSYYHIIGMHTCDWVLLPEPMFTSKMVCQPTEVKGSPFILCHLDDKVIVTKPPTTTPSPCKSID